MDGAGWTGLLVPFALSSVAAAAAVPLALGALGAGMEMEASAFAAGSFIVMIFNPYFR